MLGCLEQNIMKRLMAEIPTDDFSIEGIASAINKEFGEQMFEDVRQEIADGNIQVCDDGIIIWCS